MSSEFRFEEIGVQVSEQAIMDMLNGVRGGTFFVLHGYESKTSAEKTEDNISEKADYFCQYGIKYCNLRENAIQTVMEHVANDGMEGEIPVSYHTWVDANGNEYNRKAKDRTLQHRRFTIPADGDEAVLVMRDILFDLQNPKEFHGDYSKDAKGLYTNNSDGAWHIRDCLIVHKKVTREANWKISATTRDKAVARSVRKALNLSLDRYRQFEFNTHGDGKARFDFITIGDQAVMVNNGQYIVGLQEDAKSLALEPAE